MAERLRLSVIWDRAIAILRSESALFVPVAAAFFFLPSVIGARLLPEQALVMTAVSLSMLLPLIAMLIVQTVGQLAIVALVLDPARPTVKEAMSLALRRLPLAIGVLLALFGIVCGLLMIAQIIVMLLGGVRMGASGEAALVRLAALGLAIASPAILYLLARSSVAMPVLIRETATPFGALRRSFGLTNGNGWRIVALMLVAGFLYLFVMLALGTAFGAVFTLLGRLLGVPGVGNLLAMLFSGALGAAATLVVTVALACLYRVLEGGSTSGR